MNPAVQGIFVTGTDTGVGKTSISAAIVALLAKSGVRIAGLKPVAAGMAVIDDERINEDVRALREVSVPALCADEIAACQFDAACAPHIAAALEGRHIERDAVLKSVRAIAARYDRVVVEGVGGFRVPFDDTGTWDSADLAVDLGLPVLLVVGLRLGCINHALLTAEAIRARGLPLCGWIANTVDAPMPYMKGNLDALARGLGNAPCLGLVPHLPMHNPTPEIIAPYLNVAALHALFQSQTILSETP